MTPYAPPRFESQRASVLDPGVARAWLLGVLALQLVLVTAAGAVMRTELFSPRLLFPVSAYNAAFQAHAILGTYGLMTLFAPAIASVVIAREAPHPTARAIVMGACGATSLLVVPAFVAARALERPSVAFGAAAIAMAGVAIASADVVLVIATRVRRRSASRFPNLEMTLLVGCAVETVVCGVACAALARAALGDGTPEPPPVWIGAGFGVVLGPCVGVLGDLGDAPRMRASAFAGAALTLSPVIALAGVGAPITSLAELLVVAVAAVACVRRLSRADARRAVSPAWVYAAALALTALLTSVVRAFTDSISIDVHLHDTLFVVGRLHYESACAILAIAAVAHASSSWVARAAYPRRMRTVAALLVVLGLHVSFFAELVLGSRGMPRRYVSHLSQFDGGHRIAATGAYVLALGATLAFVALAKAALARRAT